MVLNLRNIYIWKLNKGKNNQTAIELTSHLHFAFWFDTFT